MSTAWTLTFDCANPAALAAFWCQALGYVEGASPAGFATWEEWLASVGVPPEEWGDGAYIEDPAGLRPGISFLKVPEAKTAKNRVHLDVQAGGGRGEADVLASCYRRSLEVADGLRARSVAFPAIATGVYGFPPRLAAQIGRSFIDAPPADLHLFIERLFGG